MVNDVRAVIFDWAGTVVDYGCFAPVQAFLEAFKEVGVEITIEEARQPMGLLKKDHIKEILKMERVQNTWERKFNRPSNLSDVNEIYHSFEKKLFESLQDYTDPIPGAIETIEKLRKRNIKIGSTTGYTREMMDVVEQCAKIKGYSPDYLTCADEVEQGRPYPHMIFQNMMALSVFPPTQVVKVGDTTSDMREGKNAGVWSIGIIRGSSELGLTEEEVEHLSVLEYENLANKIAARFKEAGADFVIDSIKELPKIIEIIENGRK